jgi:hypothetical protein
MMEYFVEWAVHITADTPEEAAREALETFLQRPTDSMYFDVTNEDRKTVTLHVSDFIY